MPIAQLPWGAKHRPHAGIRSLSRLLREEICFNLGKLLLESARTNALHPKLQ
jgi:hypothetical protein